MLVDAGVGRDAEPERPLKRRKARGAGARGGRPDTQGGADEGKKADSQVEDEEDEDEGVEFEDVEIPKPTVQTTFMASEDDDLETETDSSAFGDVDFNVPPPDGESSKPSEKAIELNLTAQKASMEPAPGKRKGVKKKPLTKEDRMRRLEVHKTHLLCLIYHCARRNHWCNDEKVQKCLKPLLTPYMAKSLHPNRKLSQFMQTETFKGGLEEILHMFMLKYQITERGMRRACWAADGDDLSNVRDPPPHYCLSISLVVCLLVYHCSTSRLHTWKFVWIRRTSSRLRKRSRAHATSAPSSIVRYYGPLGLELDLCALYSH